MVMKMAMSIYLKQICDDFGLTKFGVRHALEQYQILVTELTDGFFSKLTYDAPVILDRARECFEKDYVEDHPVKTAKLIPDPDRERHWHCSNCGNVFGMAARVFKYCPMCGARMDGEDSNE